MAQEQAQATEEQGVVTPEDSDQLGPLYLAPGTTALEVTNETAGDISKGPYFFPGDTTKVVVIPTSEITLLRSRRGLAVKELDSIPEDQEIDRAFSFVKDQDQNVTNRSPGSLDDWLSPTSAETSATPALKHGRLPEIRLEKGARNRAEELGVDLFSVSGTGEEGMVLIRDVENAFEGIAPQREAGVKGGAVHPHQEGVLAAYEDSGEESSESPVPAGGVNEEQEEVLEEDQRDAIEYQREVDTATPPPPHDSGIAPEPAADQHVTASPEEQAEVDATEAARRKAEELNVDLTNVEGTGKGNRVTVEDVENYRLPVEDTEADTVGPIVTPDEEGPEQPNPPRESGVE